MFMTKNILKLLENERPLESKEVIRIQPNMDIHILTYRFLESIVESLCLQD